MYLGVISLIVSIVSLCFSVYVFLKNKLYSNISIENQLFSNINNAVTTYHDQLSDDTVFQYDTSNLANSVKEGFRSSVDSVLSAYDFACMQYETTAIDESRFTALYLSDIKSFMEKDIFKAALNNPDKYKYLKEFIKRHQD